VIAAKKNLQPNIWDYVAGGAESEVTLRRNRSAFERFAFCPRALRDVSQRDTSIRFLDRRLDLPVMLAPIGSIAHLDPGGARTCARVAERAGIAAFVSTFSSPSLETVSEATQAPLFFQLYVVKNRTTTADLIRRAESAGYGAICITVDTPVPGRRERDLRNGFAVWPSLPRPNVPGQGLAPNVANPAQAALTWRDLEWMRGTTGLPLMVKGIMCAEDARIAIEHGVDVVYVSNHGGRELDHAIATIEVLSEIVDEVAGRAEVLIDSGFMRGTDVLKALALGARAVSIGKLTACGLAAGGELGLLRALELLKLEIDVTMAHIGVATIGELTPDVLRRSVPPEPDPWPTGL
jgi:isopentenyl diphosphate isomerase/L-lactate dehydrogenase-like FMN-dependent dehydrogenase